MLARERSSATYQVSAYYISNILLEFPVQVLTSLLWSSIVYFAVPLKLTPGAFFFYALIILLGSDCGLTMAQLVSVAFESQPVAMAALGVVSVLMVMFAGFFIHQNLIPYYWIWMYWISYAHYALAAIYINEFADNSNYGAVGPSALQSVSLENVSQFTMMGGLMASVVILRIAGYLAFRLRKFQKR